MTDDNQDVERRVTFMRLVTNLITAVVAVLAVAGFLVLLQYVASIGLPNVR